MSATNLELCVATLKAAVASELTGYPAVADGRRPKTSRGQKWAWVERRPDVDVSPRIAGARIRDYKLRLHMLRKQNSKQEASVPDAALQSDAETIRDHFDGKGLGSFATLTGIIEIAAVISSRDEDATHNDQETLIDFDFPFYEVL